MQLDKKYDIATVEKKWQDFWEEEAIFKFNPNTKKEIFSLDTPPPTVSGTMHIGHALAYSQADFVMRFQRMRGKEIFYPFGFDDNGLATERFVEDKANVRGNSMPRKQFKELCLKVTKDTEEKLRQKWKSLGISPDWTLLYRTIDDNAQRISQLSFIDLYEKGRVYQKEAPTLWCPHCGTAIAQAELEDKELQTFFNDIVFKLEDGRDLIISTTRPELLPACVAVFIHPDDKRYSSLVGKKARVPLFNFEVPILSDERVDIEKGSGAVMCCTFGDTTDMEWYFAYNLPLKVAIDPAGRMTELAGKYKGLTSKEARKAIIEDLKKAGLLKNQRQITHTVNVHERCGHEIEIIHTKQWFIKYLDLKDKFIELGRQLEWHPPHMRHRYENWIKGLQWDWCISRQRFHGVPFPVWYCENCGEAIIAKKEDLPVDPLVDKPPLDKCPKCGHTKFIPEKDVMDTWATSSLTPMIATDWDINKASERRKLFDRVFPYSLRANGHDIISFWLFNTVVKSYFHENKLPWKVAMINGWVLDEHGRKMSKSKGNVVDPMDVIAKYGADALRYWASSKKFGEDVNYSEKDLAMGKKTVIKLWNAARFALMHIANYSLKANIKLSYLDKWLLAELNEVINNATLFFESYEFSKAKAEVERFFWNVFCDNYLEIVKDRLYNSENYPREEVESAKYTLYVALLTTLKLFAPFLVHVTEEIYQKFFKEHEGYRSIHLTSWPIPKEEWEDRNALNAGRALLSVISLVRRYKALNNLSMKAKLGVIILKVPKSIDIRIFEREIKTTLHVKELKIEEGEEIELKEARLE